MKQMCCCVLRENRALSSNRVVDLVCAKNRSKRSTKVGDGTCKAHIVGLPGYFLETEGLTDGFLQSQNFLSRQIRGV